MGFLLGSPPGSASSSGLGPASAFSALASPAGGAAQVSAQVQAQMGSDLSPGRLDGAVGAGGDVGEGGVRVLLVDDHEDILGLMRMMMEKRSYCVEIALSGEQALAVAPGFKPQVVISDIGMPGMDGYELMLALRAMKALGPFKSIALSGYDAHDEAARASEAGYDAQFTKPVDFDSLFKAIEALAPER